MDVYVIHCTKHTERLPNIEHHLKTLFPELKIWEGTYITHPINDAEKEMQLYTPEIRVKNKNIFSTVGEIGCYLSHHNLLKHIKQQQPSSKYTLILEDDGMLKDDVTQLQENLEKVKFDMFYLGLNIHNKGVQICDNIYSIDNAMHVYGTHAYVVNNANINKVYESTLQPLGPIDYQYETCIKNSTINAVIIYPYLCLQDRESFYSTIKNQRNAVTASRKRSKNTASKTVLCNNIKQSKEGQLRDSTRMKKISSTPSFVSASKPSSQPSSTPKPPSSNTRKRTKTRTRTLAR